MIDYKLEFEKAQEALKIAENMIAVKTAEIKELLAFRDKLQEANKRIRSENARLKNAIIAKFLGTELGGEDD